MDLKKLFGTVGLDAAKVGVVGLGAIPGVGQIVAPLAGKLVDKLGEHMSPAAQAELTQAAVVAKPDIDALELEHETQIAQIASANIIADSSSSDWFVRRARPAFLWVMILAMFFSVVIFPILNLIDHKGLNVLEIPSGYLDLFGAAFLGYSGMRTAEKIKGKD